MARINVDDDVESRDEYKKLRKLLGGDDDRAMGMLIRFWRLAQKHWGEHQLVPMDDIEFGDLQPILESRWGIQKEDGVYAVGAEERFAWYRQQRDLAVAGGLARASAPRDESGKFIPKANAAPAASQPESSHGPAVDQPDASRNPASASVLVPVPSLAPVIKKENTETNAVAIAPAEALGISKRSKFNQTTRGKMVSFIRKYAEVWKAKYKSNPEGLKDKALIGKIGHWIEGVSEERALDLIQVYLQVDYRPINDSCHDLWQFFRHLNRIGIAVDSGQDTAGINWTEVFGRTA